MSDQEPQTNPPLPPPKRNAILQASLLIRDGQFSFDVQGFGGLDDAAVLVLEKVLIADRNQSLLNVGLDALSRYGGPSVDAAMDAIRPKF